MNKGRPVVDRALKQRWERALERLRGARSGEAAGWDDLYEVLGEILEQRLYLGGGHASERAFLKAEVPDLSERTVRSRIRVARHFDPEDEARHGVARLDRLLDYVEAGGGGGPRDPGRIDLTRQEVAVPRGREVVLVPFAEASMQDLLAAVRRARGQAGGGAAGGREAERRQPPVVRAIRAALRAAGVRDARVSLKEGRVDLGGLPVERLHAAGRALAAAKLPATGSGATKAAAKPAPGRVAKAAAKRTPARVAKPPVAKAPGGARKTRPAAAGRRGAAR